MLSLVAVLLVAGCGARVDLAKATYLRTTVPAAKLREVDARALHWCTWRRDSAEIWVWLRLGVDPVRTADETKIQKVDVGVPAVQEADTGSGAKRSVEWSHLALAGSNAEVVNATYIRYDTQQREDACAMARGVAKTLVPKLPKS